jgi:hypothetical protein
MSDHFRLVPFLVGLAVGYVLINFYTSPAHTILEYPHPDNVVNRIYRDANGVCYRYNAKDVNCNEHETSLKPYPLQG